MTSYVCCMNPAVSERQRKFMCVELGRKRSGKKTQTGMRESQLKDFCMKNPVDKLSKAQVLKYFREEISPRFGNDLPALREVWNDYTDYLHKAKSITTKAYETWTVSNKDLVVRRKREENPGEGYYVMKWGGGRYTSVAWYATKVEAQKEVDHIKMVGAWRGMPPKIEDAARKKNPGKLEKVVGFTKRALRAYDAFKQKNPARVVSHKQALALTKKILAYAKKLYRHEQSGMKKNPGEHYHSEKFRAYMNELSRYPLGSTPYLTTLAKAYEHLGSQRESVRY